MKGSALQVPNILTAYKEGPPITPRGSAQPRRSSPSSRPRTAPPPTAPRPRWRHHYPASPPTRRRSTATPDLLYNHQQQVPPNPQTLISTPPSSPELIHRPHRSWLRHRSSFLIGAQLQSESFFPITCPQSDLNVVHV
jgi:hypothetical protein